MIHSFSCKNFYSFKDLTIIDFTVNDKAPSNDGYFQATSDAHLSKIETVIGPNASGKTNLLKILPFLKWLIVTSFNASPNAPLPIKPFLFGNNKNKSTELSVDFEINGNIYVYTFILNEKKIIAEEIKVKNKTTKKVTTKKVFSRKWNEEKNKYELDDKKFNLPKGYEELLRSNASIISVASRFNHKKSLEIFNFWQNIETNVIEAGWVGNHLLPNANQQLIEAFDFFSEKKNAHIKAEAEKLLSQFDLGLDSFEIKKEKKDNGLSINVRVAHTFGGEKKYIPIKYESSGTKQLFVLLKTILLVLANGGAAILDEFDVNLHPEIVLALFDLFMQPETNPKNAQLLFSSHSHQILSKLDKYQIVLTEKNEKGESEAWRLDDVTGVRADDNYYSKYIAGAYGAVPKL
ncbi:ATP-binding protein [Candidatus Parcubacteria bacterium]|nr:ATP-binding protein [Candidatus Parcubacteria bacterium]